MKIKILIPVLLLTALFILPSQEEPDTPAKTSAAEKEEKPTETKRLKKA